MAALWVLWPRDELYLLQYDRSKFPAERVTGRAGEVDFGWYAFGLHDRNGWVLIDTGARGRTTTVKALLEQAGGKPSEVHDIVLTHAHWDHAGAVRDFPQARIWMSRAEWERLQAGPWLNGYRKQELDSLRGRDLHLFDEQATLGPLTLTRVGGHTPGMLAVTVRLGARRWLLAGDNAYLPSNFATPLPEKAREGPPADLSRLSAGATLVPGHDPSLLETPVGFKRLYP